MQKVDRRGIIRNEIISFLKSVKKEKNKYISISEIIRWVEEKIKTTEGIVNLPHPDKDIIKEEIHFLLTNNILMRAGDWEATSENNLKWTDLKLTAYGKECLEKDYIIPLDPDGYLETIKRALPKIDSVILEYLGESIVAFNKNLILSSVITLGVASEQAILLLIENFCGYLENNSSKYKEQIAFLKDGKKQEPIYRKYKKFNETLEGFSREEKNKLPDEYKEIIGTVFNFVRKNRNDANHPKIIEKDRMLQGANLQAFKSYLKTIYSLMEYFDNMKEKQVTDKTVLLTSA